MADVKPKTIPELEARQRERNAGVAPRRGLNNANTRFAPFTWGEDERIRRSIQALRDRLYPEKLPTRFKIKL